jgi:hypothetical protein
MFSMTLSRPPEWFGTGKLQHGWTVSEEVEQRHRRAVAAENERRLRSVLGERRRSRRHRSQGEGDVEKDIVGGIND